MPKPAASAAPIDREALIEKIKTDPAYQKVFLQEKSKVSLRYFCRNILGYSDMNREHEALCDYLQFDEAKVKLMLMPRYTFKSSIITIGHTLWLLANDPNERVLIYSDATDKAEGFLLGIKNHIEGKVSGSLFRAVFGKWEVDPKRGVWNQSGIVVSPRTKASVEPSVDTAGVETSKVGKHYSRMKFDDLVSDKNVTTKELMDKVASVYKNAGSLLQPSGNTDIAGTRWHYGDLYGRLLAEYRGDPKFSCFIRKAHEGEKYFFMDIGKDSLTPEFLAAKKKDQGSYVYSCNPGEAPIMLGDFTSKRIDQIQPGDEVVGWTTWNGSRQRRLAKTIVTKVQSRMAPIVKITLKSGRVLRCTPEHRWYTGRSPKDPTHAEYLPAKVGRKLMFVAEPHIPVLKPELAHAASWLVGMFDGEGHVSVGSINIAQSREHNPEVCVAVKEAVELLGFDYNQSPSGDTVINGALAEKRRFAHWCNPIKKDRIIDNIYRRGGKFIREEDAVVSIEPDGEERVYALVTGTGNYIAWGYASKNCLYQNEPTDDETATFKVADFSFYNKHEIPAGLFITACLDPIPPHEGTRGDDAALTVCGTDHELNLYILDIVRGRLQPSEQIEELFRLHAKWQFNVFGVETNAFQKVMRRDIEFRYKEERQRNPNFRFFHIEEFVGSSLPNKELRIRGLQPYHERGALRFPGTSVDTLTGVWGELAFQLIQFPKSAKDDIADSLAGHVMIHRPGSQHQQKKDIPFSSAAWYEREIWYKNRVREIARLPRWKRPEQPSLSLS